jgi:hypothetical protein
MYLDEDKCRQNFIYRPGAAEERGHSEGASVGHPWKMIERQFTTNLVPCSFFCDKSDYFY